MTQRVAIGAMCLLACAGVLPAQTRSSEEEPFRRIVMEQFRRYPKLEIADLYKLVYQATFGPRHMGIDSSAARVWLLKEWNDTTAGPEEPVVDTICAGGEVLVRVNIRPYRSRGGSFEVLLRAFLVSARTRRGSPEILEKYWSYLVGAAGEVTTPFSPGELRAFLRGEREKGFPVPEHSDAYLREYRPSYRVVLARELK